LVSGFGFPVSGYETDVKIKAVVIGLTE